MVASWRLRHEIGPGWREIVERALGRLEALAPGKVTVDQVKEKFGGLRIYWHTTEDVSDEVWAALEATVEAAEIEAWRTCELSGEPGELHIKDGWLKTLSPEQAAELGYAPYRRWSGGNNES